MTAAPQVNQPTLGEIIEERRLQLGLTKSEAARLAGVSRGTWHEVETGKRANMLADTLNLFDKALGYERGTLRQATRPQPMSDLVPRTPAPAVFISHSHDEDLELRMQLVRLAMTMTGDEVRSAIHVVEGLQRLVRAELSTRDDEGDPGDRPNPGRNQSNHDAARDQQVAGAG